MRALSLTILTPITLEQLDDVLDQFAARLAAPEARQAFALLRATCEKGHDGFGACGHLGMILLGHAAAERAEGALLLDRACEGADALACYRLGVFYASGSRGFMKDERRAVQLFERACAEGGQACAEARELREKLGVDF